MVHPFVEVISAPGEGLLNDGTGCKLCPLVTTFRFMKDQPLENLQKCGTIIFILKHYTHNIIVDVILEVVLLLLYLLLHDNVDVNKLQQIMLV